MAFFAFLAAVPLIGWVTTAFLSTVVAGVALSIFNSMQVTLFKLVLLGAGLYILLGITLPKIAGAKGKQAQNLLILSIFGVLLILLGVPNYVFSVLGSTAKYSVLISLP